MLTCWRSQLVQLHVLSALETETIPDAFCINASGLMDMNLCLHFLDLLPQGQIPVLFQQIIQCIMKCY